MAKKVSRKKRQATLKVRADFDWRTLKKGDEVYIVQGSGPYVLYRNERGEEIKEMMAEYGWYTVQSVVRDGIHAYDSYGHHFIWMKDETETSPSGIIREKHKIGKVKLKDELV